MLETILLVWLMLLGATLHFWFAAYVLKAWHMVWQSICEYGSQPVGRAAPAFTEADWAAHWAGEIQKGKVANAQLLANLGLTPR